MIKLFEHNQTAYDAVQEQLAQTGKAAVIHPTGTGKTFIAFKLAEEHPGESWKCLKKDPEKLLFKRQKSF